jgi:hypothetical protein
MENAATKAFYTTLFTADNPEWHCTKTRAKLREENLELSHTSMDGHQLLEPGRVTTGVLSVRSTDVNNQRFMRGLTDALANGAQFFFSEIATPRHPFYLDFDFSLNVRDADQVQMMVDVIRLADMKTVSCPTLDDSVLFNRQTTADGRTLQYLNLNKRDILNHHASLQAHLLSLYPDGVYSWLQVFDACLTFDIAGSPTSSNSGFAAEPALYSRLDGSLLTVLSVHFILAIGKLVQAVVARFYPSLVEDARLELAVLGNYAGDRHLPWNPKYDVVDGKVKIGAHLHVRGLKVDHSSDLLILEGIIHYFSRTLTRRGGPDAAFWRQVFDVAVYREGCGGLRMPFNFKMVPCACKTRKHHCARCHHTGHTVVDRYYAPVGVFLASGLYDDTERTLNRWFKNVMFVLTMCSLRVSPDHRLTPGFVKPADVPEPNALQARREEFKERLGVTVLKKLESKRDEAAITDDQLTHELEAKIFLLDNSLKLSRTRSETLLPRITGDGRYETIAEWLPAMASRVMNAQYINLKVSGVILVRACKDGEPESLYVQVRGTGSNLCFNRMSDSSASALTETYWNAHNGWKNTVFFCINRVGLTLVQKCSNANERPSRRNKDPVSNMGCCKNWLGISRKLDPSSVGQPMDDDGMHFFKAIVRNMFYKRSEQSSVQSAAVLAAQAQRLQRLYRKRAFSEIDIVGNDENYEAMLRTRLNKQTRNESFSVAGDGSMDGF